jgi:release factor glutamine methyltransferase
VTDDLVATLRAAGCVFAEDEARLLRAQARTPGELEELVRRRVAGEPLEHVLGWAEFEGLRIPVGPGVFVPRQRTALLVAQALAGLAAVGRPAVVVDACCGSGAVAAAVAARLPAGDAVEIHATEIDEVAVRSARSTLAGVAEVHHGDLLEALPARLRHRVDVVAASPPYVPTEAVRLMPPEARDHEPRTALDGGADGLDVVRRLVAQAPAWLRPGGLLLLDLGETQTEATAGILTAANFDPDAVTDEDLGATVVVGRLGRDGRSQR